MRRSPEVGLFDNVSPAGRYFNPRYREGRYWSRYGGGVSTNPEDHPTSFMIKGLLSVIGENGVPPAGKAVELGCGQGQLTTILAKKGYWVEAVDDSPQAIRDTLELANTHIKDIIGANGGFWGTHMDIRRFPFILKPYDLLSA